MKKHKQLQNNQRLIVFIGSIALVWLFALTAFSAWAWNQHLWQAEQDSNAIYRLSVENVEQQNAIEKLHKQ